MGGVGHVTSYYQYPVSPVLRWYIHHNYIINIIYYYNADSTVIAKCSAELRDVDVAKQINSFTTQPLLDRYG